MNGIALLLALAMIGTTQNPGQKPPQHQEPVTVSGGISKQQLAAEQRLNDVLAAGDQARRLKDSAGAIRQYEKAREMARSDKLLAEQQDRVLNKLGRAYLDGSRFSEAVAVYTTLLELRHDDCQPGSEQPSACADAKQTLGYSKMLAGDFEGALPVLREAEADFGAAPKADALEEYRMITAKEQAETRLLIATTLFRLGKQQEAVAATESAIEQFKRVESDDKIQQSIRSSAADSRRQAEQQLQLINH